MTIAKDFMRMRKLFLDDFRDPPDIAWDVVRGYQEFVDYIEQNGVPDLISFDHDLGSFADNNYSEKTGLDCARFLIERGTLPKKWYVHSTNLVGAKNIRVELIAASRRDRKNK
jgi:NAD+-processing family protein with receiver domain